MDFNVLFGAGLWLSVVTYVLFQLKAVPAILFNQIKKRVIYTATIEETSTLYGYLEAWLYKFHGDSYRNISATINDDGNIRLKHFDDVFSIKYAGKRLYIKKGREKFENAGDIRSAFYNHFKIYGVNAKKVINMLLTEVVKYNKSLLKTEQYVYISDSVGEWCYVGTIAGKNISSIVLDEKEKIINDVEHFLSQETWYHERGIPYKRGYLFYGSPGNGKTSLAMAIAKHINKNIFFMNLNDFEKDAKLVMAFANIEKGSVVVLEDIDAAFADRNGNKNVSFSCLLNCIDGALSLNKSIVIMTTNHVDRIDDALIRDGRIDMRIKISNPDKTAVEEYLSLFFNKKVKLNKYNRDISMSCIQGICMANRNNIDNAIKIIEVDDEKNV